MSGAWGSGNWGGGNWGGGSALPLAVDGELDAYSADPGVDAGRLIPAAVDAGLPLDGVDVMCLGHDVPGFFGFLNIGDFTEVSQTLTLTAGTKALTFLSRLRPPASSPGIGRGWKASVLIDNVEVSSRTLDAAGAAPSDPQNWIVNVSKLAAGAHKFSFRLTLT